MCVHPSLLLSLSDSLLRAFIRAAFLSPSLFVASFFAAALGIFDEALLSFQSRVSKSQVCAVPRRAAYCCMMLYSAVGVHAAVLCLAIGCLGGIAVMVMTMMITMMVLMNY